MPRLPKRQRMLVERLAGVWAQDHRSELMEQAIERCCGSTKIRGVKGVDFDVRTIPDRRYRMPSRLSDGVRMVSPLDPTDFDASQDLGTGEVWPLAPGSLYNVGPKDRHRVTAVTNLHLVSVFCPPLRGDEQHDADGALAPSGPVPPGPPGY